MYAYLISMIFSYKGTILAEGSYQELQVSGVDFTKLQIELSDDEQIRTVESDIESNKIINTNSSNANPCLSIRGSKESILSCVDESKIINGSLNSVDEKPNEEPETRSSGNMSKSIYVSYFSASGNMYQVFISFVMYLITQILISGGEYWITYWYCAFFISWHIIVFNVRHFFRVNLEEHVFSHCASSLNNSTLTVDRHHNSTATYNRISDTLLWWKISRQTCIIVFAVFTFSIILAILIRTTIFVSVCMKSSIMLHNKMFNAIVKAPMYFFNTNSSGKYKIK